VSLELTVSAESMGFMFDHDDVLGKKTG